MRAMIRLRDFGLSERSEPLIPYAGFSQIRSRIIIIILIDIDQTLNLSLND